MPPMPTDPYMPEERKGQNIVLDHAELQFTHTTDMLCRQQGPQQNKILESRDLARTSVEKRRGVQGVYEDCYEPKRGSQP